MATTQNSRPDLITTVDDEVYAEMRNLVGQRILGFTVWEDRLADELEPDAMPQATHAARRDALDENSSATVDVDLYLEGGIYFELYSTFCYPDIESDPLVGVEVIRQQLSGLINGGIWLDDVAVDEDDLLVLILSRQRKPRLYLLVGGWLLDEWDELPV